MKPFLTWITSTLVVFGILGGAYHFYLERNPRKVLVAVDTSFPMKAVWGQVPDALEAIAEQRYTAFSLVTEKNRIHSWSDRLQSIKTMPYAPRKVSKLTDREYTEIDDASEKYFITNASAAEIEQLKGWTILHIAP